MQVPLTFFSIALIATRCYLTVDTLSRGLFVEKHLETLSTLRVVEFPPHSLEDIHCANAFCLDESHNWVRDPDGCPFTGTSEV